MPAKTKPARKAVSATPATAAPTIGELLSLPLDVLSEPEIAMRATMNTEALSELKASMLELGLLDPVKVVAKNGGFEVVDGHRRLVCARELKWAGLPCLVLRGRDEVLEAIKVDSNMMREDVNAAEQAIYYAQLCEKYNLTEEALCALVHKSADYIYDRMRLLKQDLEVFKHLQAGTISFAVARELNKCTDESMRRFYLDSAIRSGCASRVVADWIAQWRVTANATAQVQNQPAQPVEPQAIQPWFDHCELCGGDKDPGNLISIRIHKWEWEQLCKAYRESPGGAA